MAQEIERQTRRRRIDPRLKAAGWKVVGFDPSMPLNAYGRAAIEEYETKNGPADYALCDDGRILGVAEAKKVTLGPQGVLVQSERYSKGIHQLPKYQGEFGAPFLYATNGEEVWFHDVRNQLNRSRRVSGFHTPTALDELLTRDFDAELGALAAVQQNLKMRPYQVEAPEVATRRIGQSSQAVLAKALRGELAPIETEVSSEVR
jgi:type I restriction enzyme, R subunit